MITKDNDNLLNFRIDIMDKILQAKNKGRKLVLNKKINSKK